MASMENGNAEALIYFSYALYVLHLMSLPYWIYACLREYQRQRKMRDDVPSRAPNESEYCLLRCFLAYSLADAIRNADGVFEADNGCFYSIWGVGTMSMRLIAWWVRDAACFTGVAIWLNFTLGWTHAALGRPLPKLLMLGLRVSIVVVVLGLGVGFYFVLATNRVAVVVLSALSLVPLNVEMAVVNVRLIWSLLPELQRIASRGDDRQAKQMIFQAWATAALMLTFNVSFLAIVPAMCIDKVTKGAWSIPVAPAPLGSWIGNSALHTISSMPAGVVPVPALEVMEVLLGWLNLAACVSSCRGYGMKDGEPIGGRFVDYAAVGKDMALRLAISGKQAKEE